MSLGITVGSTNIDRELLKYFESGLSAIRDHGWRIADTMRDDIIALKENFGGAVETGLISSSGRAGHFVLQVIENVGTNAVGASLLNYPQLGIVEGRKKLPRYVKVLSFGVPMFTVAVKGVRAFIVRRSTYGYGNRREGDFPTYRRSNFAS